MYTYIFILFRALRVCLVKWFQNAATNLVIAFTVVWAPGISVSRIAFCLPCKHQITIIKKDQKKKKHCLAQVHFDYSAEMSESTKMNRPNNKNAHTMGHILFIYYCNNKLFLFWSGSRTKNSNKTVLRVQPGLTITGVICIGLALKAANITQSTNSHRVSHLIWLTQHRMYPVNADAY